MKLFSFIIACVIVFSQGAPLPMDVSDDGGITLMLPRTLKINDSLIIEGVLNNESERISVLLPAADSDDCQILYDYNSHIIEVTPGVEEYTKSTYKIDNKGGRFKLELTVKHNKYYTAEIKVDFSVNGADMPESLYLDVSKCLDSMNSIVLKEGVETINILSFEFEKSA